ncbi:MAG TPA: DUF3237 family protein, partial [Galbitalea sp.]
RDHGLRPSLSGQSTVKTSFYTARRSTPAVGRRRNRRSPGWHLLLDGANIYTHYTGLLELNDRVMNATVSGTATDWADQYFRTTPRFETGDDRYRWLTQSLFVAEGRLLAGGGVEYRVHRII